MIEASRCILHGVHILAKASPCGSKYNYKLTELCVVNGNPNHAEAFCRVPSKMQVDHGRIVTVVKYRNFVSTIMSWAMAVYLYSTSLDETQTDVLRMRFVRNGHLFHLCGYLAGHTLTPNLTAVLSPHAHSMYACVCVCAHEVQPVP